ncbi:hypothetical protein N7532_007954 [Penicillium argentinense]|uniref:Uncharacterized protein n=1 Tax=Penicillium argentinense TaxID=1131581 RepID=A0A9W9EWR4_9EURO|nr:uncharacterized protein N7532_007954 [Penicillium argentinense]KAJ5089270.1 hypothetical protein N7532_007954 [Penicillium argentinense]
MKLSAAILTSLLAATAAAAFDKNQPWGKRDYACINVYQGIPDHSAVTEGQTVHLRFNRQPTPRCSDPLAKYPASKYSVWLYNNPVRNLDTINFDEQIKIADNIPGTAGTVNVKIPANLPKVKNGDVWYLRLDTSLNTAPQMPTLFNAAGPFTIHDA